MRLARPALLVGVEPEHGKVVVHSRVRTVDQNSQSHVSSEMASKGARAGARIWPKSKSRSDDSVFKAFIHILREAGRTGPPHKGVRRVRHGVAGPETVQLSAGLKMPIGNTNDIS
ncbi:hypothetical protein PSAC2689_50055 [Paraburkholderia sacchari]